MMPKTERDAELETHKQLPKNFTHFSFELHSSRVGWGMKWICLLMVASLSGCTTTHVHKSGAVDPRYKTISVNMGGGDLSNSIKSALRADGWRVAVNDGLTVNPGSGLRFGGHGEASRYSMKLNADFVDHAFPTFERVYVFDLNVIDNLTGEEIANGNGKDVARHITQKVMTSLR